MVEDSVDDMYNGCVERMNDIVYKTWMTKKKLYNEIVHRCVEKGWNYLNKQDRQNRQAISIYTADYNE